MDPEQVHLSFGVDESEMRVTWVSQGKPSSSLLMFWENGSTGDEHQVPGHVVEFVAGGWVSERSIHVQRANMTGLKPGKTYEYKVCSGSSWTPAFTFRTLSSDRDAVIAVFGDMGVDNAISLPSLESQVKRGTIDAVFHMGDIAYDLMEREGKQGDDFLNKVQPIASRVPYQVLPGNHEAFDDFAHYDNIFSMIDSSSGQQNNFFYSTNVRGMHIVCITTEFYFMYQYMNNRLPEQFAWLRKDLAQADCPEDRLLRPWIIVMSHRPMYCSFNHFAMREEMDHLRLGFDASNRRPPYNFRFGLEELFKEFHVDVYLSGHLHVYERTLPVHMYAASQKEDPHLNPEHTIHIVTGVAGCIYGTIRFNPQPPDWSACRCSQYGYTLIQSRSDGLLIQHIDSESGYLLDDLLIRKDGSAGADHRTGDARDTASTLVLPKRRQKTTSCLAL